MAKQEKMFDYRIGSKNGFTIEYVMLHEGKCFDKLKKKYTDAVFECRTQAYAARSKCVSCGELLNPEQAAKELAKRERVITRAKRLREAREAEK